jgi:4-carboxy-3-alkylbut-2-enoyl-[acp] decarboxylase
MSAQGMRVRPERRSRIAIRGDEKGIVWLEMMDDAGGNAFSESFVGALSEAFDRVSGDPSVKCVILVGTTRVFSTGEPNAAASRARRSGGRAPADLVLGRRIIELPVPVVGAAEGHALEGGLALLLSSDAVVIARESFYGSHGSLGSADRAGSTRLLESLVSPTVARELLYGPELRRGSFFEGMSGFNAIVPKQEVRGRAREIALGMVEHPREKLLTLKRALAFPKGRALEEAMTLADLA